MKGAVFCEEHAYVNHPGPAPKDLVTCRLCDKPYERWRKSNNRWQICSDCRDPIKPLIRQANQHHVDEEALYERLRAGPLTCDLCARPLHVGHGSMGAVIDHDHRCCDSGTSCGQCVRGLLCVGCNVQIGSYEALLCRVRPEVLAGYIGLAK